MLSITTWARITWLALSWIDHRSSFFISTCWDIFFAIRPDWWCHCRVRRVAFHKKYFQPGGTVGSVLSGVLGAPPFSEADSDGVRIEGALMMGWPFLSCGLLGLGKVKSFDCVTRKNFVDGERGRIFWWKGRGWRMTFFKTFVVHGGWVDKYRDLTDVEQPHLIIDAL